MTHTSYIGDLTLDPRKLTTGRAVLAGILDMASEALLRLQNMDIQRAALSGCLRGTGPGVSFGELVAMLEQDHPLKLVSPFEGSDLVSGAAWEADKLLDNIDNRGLAKLRWSAHADDLPMHVHEHSDRFIIVAEGRGFFHVSDQPFDKFDGTSVTTVAARELDVFLFTRDVVHTFSTDEHAMTLLSVHLPYVPLEASEQWQCIATRSTLVKREPPEIICTRWHSLTPSSI